jgi:nucleotide-binding universal stress UspA family protein
MYEKILVPLDGSAFAESALPLALTLSRKTRADVRLVTVLEPVTSFAYEGWESAAVEWSHKYLEELTERIEGEAGGTVTTAVISGHTVERLQEEAANCKADVVVMASHGRGAFSRLWLGSVADGFVRQADRPVILVRPDEEAGAPERFDCTFDTLLVPLDGSELSESALEHAIDFGELFDSAYHLTRVVSYPFDVSSPYLPHTAQMNQQIVEDAKKGSAEYLEAHAERLRRRGFRVTTSVAVDAQPGSGILSEAEAVGSDVTAMATHARKGLSRVVLGSAADKVLRGTHTPLLLFRPTGIPD